MEVLIIGSFATEGMMTLSADVGTALPSQFCPSVQFVDLPPTQVKVIATAKLLCNLLAAAKHAIYGINSLRISKIRYRKQLRFHA